jgi:hypothetical protein
MYSGTKNYLGHSITNDHQLFVYADALVSEGRTLCSDDLSGRNYDGIWQNNKCILLSHDIPYLIVYCNEARLAEIPPHLNNTFYTPTGMANFSCGSTSYTLQQWQQRAGQDIGSTQAVTPNVSTIIAWGQQLLYLRTGRYITGELQW